MVFLKKFINNNKTVKNYPACNKLRTILGAQWLSRIVLDSKQRGRGFEPHRRHCVVVLEQVTFILTKLSTGSTQEDLSLFN